MTSGRWMSAVVLPLTLGALLTAAAPQGKGYGKPDKPDKAQGQGAQKQNKAPKSVKGMKETQSPGRSVAKAQAKASDRIAKAAVKAERKETRDAEKSLRKNVREAGGDVEPAEFRTMAKSKLRGERLVGIAIANARARGVADDRLFITPAGPRVQVLNSSGVVLLDLEDDRDLGSWKAVTVRDQDKKGAPSFCRSGAGHPVWGRQWCIDKGFGLGDDGEIRWGRIVEPVPIPLKRTPDTVILARDVLVDVLGDVVFNRLAAHAITLGLVEPLSGKWLGEPDGEGPRVLLLTSGNRPVAEIVDTNRDDRADMVVVALRPW